MLKNFMQNNLSKIPVNKLYYKDAGIPTGFLPGYGLNGNGRWNHFLYY